MCVVNQRYVMLILFSYVNFGVTNDIKLWLYSLVIELDYVFRQSQSQLNTHQSSQSGIMMDQVLDKHLEKIVKLSYSKNPLQLTFLCTH